LYVCSQEKKKRGKKTRVREREEVDSSQYLHADFSPPAGFSPRRHLDNDQSDVEQTDAEKVARPSRSRGRGKTRKSRSEVFQSIPESDDYSASNAGNAAERDDARGVDLDKSDEEAAERTQIGEALETVWWGPGEGDGKRGGEEEEEEGVGRGWKGGGEGEGVGDGEGGEGEEDVERMLHEMAARSSDFDEIQALLMDSDEGSAAEIEDYLSHSSSVQAELDFINRMLETAVPPSRGRLPSSPRPLHQDPPQQRAAASSSSDASYQKVAP
jgi:hypothetical protein